jgi:hypothetical protein
VNFLQKIAQRLLLVFQFILVFIFILFEEIIWEGIAKPIYEKIQALKILQKLKFQIAHTNRYVILVVFLVLLLTVEAAGLLAGVFFVQGYMLFGLTLYMAKIPIAAFVFWLFKVSKRKLLSFEWFSWSYEKLISGLAWLKELVIYKTMMEKLSTFKANIKKQWKKIKEKYFSKDSRFTDELKSFYRYIKNLKNRKESKDREEEVKKHD